MTRLWLALRERLLVPADIVAALAAASLPWSTSATTILIGIWIALAIPVVRLPVLGEVLRTPAGALPVALVAFAALGMLWADVAWPARLAGLAFFVKLLLIPLFLAQLRESPRAHWPVLAFIAACTALLIFSWTLQLVPSIQWNSKVLRAVPVKDYITQSGVFSLSAIGLLFVAATVWRKRWGVALLAIVLAALFLANVLFLAAGRTSLLALPVLALVLGLRLWNWRGLGIALLASAVIGGTVWSASPYMRARVAGIVTEAQVDRPTFRTSTGLRIEFWRDSLSAMKEVPVFGGGTGTIADMFTRMAKLDPARASEPSRNPHQQTLAVAMQIGIAGAILLWAMWIAHALLFWRSGMLAFFGLTAVVQNILGSLVNSHLFDFTQGWLYVLTVGILGGAMLRERKRDSSP